MSYARYLKELLRPLGVYRLEGGLGAGELEAVGAALDACGARLEAIQREMLLSTAENEGLERVEKLLARRPVTDSLPRRREALAALFDDLPEYVCLVFVYDLIEYKPDARTKLAAALKAQGKKVLLCAGDTFRAAAVEQLGIWAERTGSGFHSKGQDADPAAVAWEAMDVAIRDQYDILFIDTAGRLHTKSNLMDELHKIREVIARKHPGAPHRSILIVDATTGQNALQQTKIFKEAAGIDELILTKLDGTAKGGVAVAVSMQYGIPITYVGLGEKMEDLRPFNGDDFAKALLEQ